LDKTIDNKLKSYKYAEAWCKLLTDREFGYDESSYRYSVGQPMGAYSS